MNRTDRFRTAGEFVELLRLAVHEREVPANDRVRASLSCFGIAQEHQHAIVVLIEHHLYASTFALLRIAFEAFIRGAWLARCADDDQVRRFLEGSEPPKIDRLLHSLEQTPAFSERVLSTIKDQHWRAMCAYTHTGGLHVQRWNTSQAIEPSYDPQEIESVLFFAEIVAALSVLGFADIVDDEKLAERILKEIKVRSK